MTRSRRRGWFCFVPDAIFLEMTKLHPIIAEFGTEVAAKAHDKWFRVQVEARLKSTKPRNPHYEVMRPASKTIRERANAAARLGN
jgi:hypothetical protein